MTKKIVKEPDSVLHRHTGNVPIEDVSSPKIQKIIREMKAALRATDDGIGIAAPQIGYALQIFLASEEALRWDEEQEIPSKDRKKKDWAYYVFINPVIKKISAKKTHELEGCLSVPETYGIVERAEKVTVEAYDEKGHKFQRGASRLYARVMQHEIDHLCGMLFIEKAKNIRRIKKEHEKHGSSKR